MYTNCSFTDRADENVHNMIEGKFCKRSFGFIPTTFKKKIDGVVYDTSKMEHLIDYKDDTVPDYCYRYESLYRKPDGKYLLAGEGMAFSPWSKKLRDCDDRVMGHAFVPLELDEVKIWLECRGLEDEAEEFMNRSESDLAEIIAYVPNELVARIENAAKNQGATVQEWCRAAVEAALDQKP